MITQILVEESEGDISLCSDRLLGLVIQVGGGCLLLRLNGKSARPCVATNWCVAVFRASIKSLG